MEKGENKQKKKYKVFFSHRKPLKICEGGGKREFHIQNRNFSTPEKYATYRVYFFYMSVEHEFLGGTPVYCIERREWWDDAMLAGESACSARTWEISPTRTDLVEVASSLCLHFSS